MSRYICTEPGCDKGRSSGHVLYRTSPKGELFEGRCAEHFGGEVDPVAQVIEDDNQRPSEPHPMTGGGDAPRADVTRAAAVEREALAEVLCERHQQASPTRIPCAACSQDADALAAEVAARVRRGGGRGVVAHV
jgi:hypothetical protein